jgi:HSP20 family protein
MDRVRHRPNAVRGWNDPLNQLDRLFQSALLNPDADLSAAETSQWVPAVDIREDHNQFVVEADVPGVDPNTIDITLENNMLTIRGERQEEKSTSDDEGSGARRIERAYGAFYRRFTLPDTADPESVKARNDNGVLRIEIGKKEAAQAKRIPVESG